MAAGAAFLCPASEDVYKRQVLSRLILPLGDFVPEDVAEMAEDFKL